MILKMKNGNWLKTEDLIEVDRMSISQAGRRGFDPCLPLHLFNNLGETPKTLCSKMLQLEISQRKFQ